MNLKCTAHLTSFLNSTLTAQSLFGKWRSPLTPGGGDKSCRDVAVIGIFKHVFREIVRYRENRRTISKKWARSIGCGLYECGFEINFYDRLFLEIGRQFEDFTPFSRGKSINKNVDFVLC